MRIVWVELKKIFTLKMVLIATGICLFWFYFQLSYYLVPSQHKMGDSDYSTQVSIQMINDYGTEMDTREYEEFKKIYASQVKQASLYIHSDEKFRKANLTSYPQFRKRSQMENGGTMALENRIRAGEYKNLFGELRAREFLMQQYKYRNFYSDGQEHLDRRLHEVRERESVSIFPLGIFSYYSSMIYNMAVLVLLICSIMIAPVYIRDRLGRVNTLQYSSKIGRSIFVSQWIAAAAASFIIATFLLGSFLVAYSFNGNLLFFTANINSVFNGVFWYDLTFVQYILLTLAIVYLLALIIALFTAFISSLAANYLILVGIQAMLLFLFFKEDWIVTSLLQNITTIYRPKLYQPIWLGTLLLIGLIMMYGKWLSERKKGLKG